MYIKRILEEHVLKLTKQFPVVCVYGARSVGKSTMLNHILPSKFHSCSVDSIMDQKIAKEDPRGFILSHGVPLFIDEIQKVPELIDEIKSIVDEKARNGENTNGLFWISGSNKIALKTKAQESLAGRVAIIEMSSLSKEEIEGRNEGVFNPLYQDICKRQFKALSEKELFSMIFNGGYPKLQNSDIDKEVFYSSYIDTYLEKDIRELIQDANISKFLNLLIYLSGHIAEQIDITDASKIIGTNVKTIGNWMDILEETGIIFRLKPYANKLSTRLVKSPKMYFLDTGLAAYLSRWLTSEQMRIGANSGHFLENYIVSEIIKSHYNNLKRLDYLFYYRDFDQREFNLLFADNVSLIPLEIKKNTNPNIPSIELFQKFKMEIKEKYILYGDNKVYQLSNGWILLPISII